MFLNRNNNIIKLSILPQLIWNLIRISIKMKPLMLLDKWILKFIWKNKHIGRQFSMGLSCFWMSRSNDYLGSKLSFHECFGKEEIVSPSGEKANLFPVQ